VHDKHISGQYDPATFSVVPFESPETPRDDPPVFISGQCKVISSPIKAVSVSGTYPGVDVVVVVDVEVLPPLAPFPPQAVRRRAVASKISAGPLPSFSRLSAKEVKAATLTNKLR
jgi:hypothetical protein